MRCGTLGSPSNWLEFHHILPEKNVNSYQRSRDVVAHREKYLLLCRTHHLETHARQIKASGRINPDSFMDLKAGRTLRIRALEEKMDDNRRRIQDVLESLSDTRKELEAITAQWEEGERTKRSRN